MTSQDAVVLAVMMEQLRLIYEQLRAARKAI